MVESLALGRGSEMHALVTGAAGFVGQWLTEALRRDGVAVTALATEPLPATTAAIASDQRTVAPIAWHYGDLRDARYVNSVLASARFDYVVHLAAISHVPTAEADPALAWDVNVTSTAKLLDAVCRTRNTGAADPMVLVVGSAEQYGRHPDASMPLSEDAAQQPRTVYAATKAAQEVLALQLWRATGVKIVVARSFNHSGRGQEPRFVMPALVSRARALKAAPAGTPLRLGNVTPVRDFLHVSDVVAAYIALCRRGTPGEAYNVASGRGVSVQSIVDAVLSRTGVHADLVVDPELVRQVDIPALVGDSRKLQLATGWQPTRSFEDIIDDLIHASTY